MIELRVSWWRVLLGRLYWQKPVEIEGTDTLWELRPRRFAWMLRPLMNFEEVA